MEIFENKRGCDPIVTSHKFAFIVLNVRRSSPRDANNLTFSNIVTSKLICEGSLLDTMLDRFGTKGVYYGWIDEEHFVCEPTVELNHQFYGWVCGFGESIKIATPEIAERYANYLKRVTAMY